MTGLVGYWPLNESSGDARDFSGNGNTGTLNGGVTQGVAGKSGLQGYSFDGSDDHVQANGATLSENSTVSGWYYVTKNDSCLWRFQDSNGLQLTVRFNGEIGINSGDISAVDFKPAIKNEWVHYALTIEDTGSDLLFKLFENGEFASSTQISTSLPETDMQIGDSYGGNPFGGRMSDIRLYNRPLSPLEVRELYRQGSADLAQPADDGVAYYKLDGDATDSFGTNDGTNNGATFVDGIRGQAGDFDGSGRIDTTISSIELPYSISFWAKPSNISASDQHAISNFNSSGQDIYVRLDSGSWLSRCDVIGNTTSPVSANEGEWQLITATVNSNGHKLYKNGLLAGKDSGGTGTSTTGNNEYIGAKPDGTSNFLGQIDDVRIYDRALESYEIQELYQHGTLGIDQTENLVNY